jgi:2-isopropylmalate synthase
MDLQREFQILDTTLREGEQTPRISFTIKQKIEIARRLDTFGVDFIELGHPAVSPDVYESVEALNDLPMSAEKIVHGRATKSDMNIGATIGVPWMGIFFGTSPLSLKHKFNVTRMEAVQRIETAIKYGKDKGLKLRFTAEDASRTGIDFLIKIAQIAQSSGADRFSIADTVGILTPAKTKELVNRIISEIDIPVHFHCHNDFGLATANALSALEMGAQCIDVTVNGLGERCGLPPLAEVTTALVELYKVNKDWDLDQIQGLSDFVEKVSKFDRKANRPIIGENAFSHKAGLHVKAVLKDPNSYEAISPEKLNRKREIIIDKYTGRAAIKYRLSELGIDLDEENISDIIVKIKSQPRTIVWTDDELRSLLNNV